MQGCVSDTNGGQSVKEDVVRYDVKGRTQIKEDENSEVFGVCCHEKVIGDFNQGCLCAVEGAETRLKLFVKIIEG